MEKTKSIHTSSTWHILSVMVPIIIIMLIILFRYAEDKVTMLIIYTIMMYFIGGGWLNTVYVFSDKIKITYPAFPWRKVKNIAVNDIEKIRIRNMRGKVMIIYLKKKNGGYRKKIVGLGFINLENLAVEFEKVGLEIDPKSIF